MSPGPTPVSIGRRRWLMLALGLVAQAASSAFLYGLPFLLPELRRTYGLSLAQAGLLVSAPSLGLVATLVAWGAFVDRFGERLAMSLGLGLTGALVALTRVTDNLVVIGLLFGLAGAASGSVNAASGRVVMGWFGAHERGLAMGARQMAQPIGVALAALVLPPLAAAVGLRDALLAPAAFCGFVAALVVALVKDPPRPERGVGPPSANPYRTSTLWRLHASSALLVVPQFVVTVFSEEYLVAVRHWPAGSAGRVLALVQLAGACGRLVVGRWSDHVGSRLRPMRQIAVLSAAAMVAVGVASASGSAVILLALAAATVISVTDNGLGFTATAELAGRDWSGRALGMQNTGQNIVAFATPSLFAFLVGQLDYAGAFLVCAVFPAIGVLTTPVRAERVALDASADRSRERTPAPARPRPDRSVAPGASPSSGDAGATRRP